MTESGFSLFTIEALVQTISGGTGSATGSREASIGRYRTGPQIESFLLECGIDPASGSTSRLPKLREALRRAATQPNGDEPIRHAIEKVADPRNHPDEPDKTEAVIAHLNGALEADGFEVVILGGKAHLRRRGTGAAVLDTFATKVRLLDFDTVSQEIDRAIANAEDDPEDAVTAACATLEAVCRSILVELGEPLPAKRDMTGLMKAVQEPLALSPSRADLPAEIAEDVRRILGGLANTMAGIGALRTHAGDAHGRERGRVRIDARIARLAVHAASTTALFLVETWERQQKRALPNREGAA